MSKFAVGDKVRRTKTLFGDYKGMNVDDVDIVVSLEGEHSVTLEKFGSGHSPDMLILETAGDGFRPITVETALAHSVRVTDVGGVAIYSAGCFTGNFEEATARVKGREAYQMALAYLKHMADAAGLLEEAEPEPITIELTAAEATCLAMIGMNVGGDDKVSRRKDMESIRQKLGAEGVNIVPSSEGVDGSIYFRDKTYG